ncbi:MAG: amidohydrolase family protein [Clostridiales bacterium]|nr:amidohydrolase family protein [Clostridiales bacterium]
MSATLIRGGTLVDGTGDAPRRADVLVRGDRIERAAPRIEPGQSDEVIDAAGLVVCPGFVDIHRHLDVKLLTGWDGAAELRQGVTAAVAGNCGLSLTPASADCADEQRALLAPVVGAIGDGLPRAFPEYIAALAAARLPLNAGALIGTGAVRIFLKGFSNSPFTPRELDAAEGLIDSALCAGALGASMGIMYLPECHTTPAEYAKMLRPLGRHGRTLAAHIRGEGDHLVDSVREAIDIADRAGCALEISHFKSCGVDNWRREIHRAIDEIERARAAGRDVACDFYPYDGGSTALTTMLPPDFIGGGLKRALDWLGTPRGVDAFRRAAAQRYGQWDNFALSLGWDRIVISGVAADENRRFVGLTVSAAAERFGFADEIACAAHLMHTDAGRTAIINMSMCQDDIDAVARLPYSSVISDALYADAGAPHPRRMGAFPKVLREYVRERGVLTLPQAIRKMTSLPASRLGIAGRGLAAPGYFADLLAFDPAQFADNATYAHPTRPAEGLRLAMVNGRAAVRDDQPIGGAPGALLIGGI